MLDIYYKYVIMQDKATLMKFSGTLPIYLAAFFGILASMNTHAFIMDVGDKATAVFVDFSAMMGGVGFIIRFILGPWVDQEDQKQIAKPPKG